MEGRSLYYFWWGRICPTSSSSPLQHTSWRVQWQWPEQSRDLRHCIDEDSRAQTGIVQVTSMASSSVHASSVSSLDPSAALPHTLPLLLSAGRPLWPIFPPLNPPTSSSSSRPIFHPPTSATSHKCTIAEHLRVLIAHRPKSTIQFTTETRQYPEYHNIRCGTATLAFNFAPFLFCMAQIESRDGGCGGDESRDRIWNRLELHWIWLARAFPVRKRSYRYLWGSPWLKLR